MTKLSIYRADFRAEHEVGMRTEAGCLTPIHQSILPSDDMTVCSDICHWRTELLHPRSTKKGQRASAQHNANLIILVYYICEVSEKNRKCSDWHYRRKAGLFNCSVQRTEISHRNNSFNGNVNVSEIWMAGNHQRSRAIYKLSNGFLSVVCNKMKAKLKYQLFARFLSVAVRNKLCFVRSHV